MFFGFKIVYVSCYDTQSGLKGFDPDISNLSKACVVSKLSKYRRYLILRKVIISNGNSVLIHVTFLEAICPIINNIDSQQGEI